MAARGYTTIQNILTHTGQTLSNEQLAYADLLMEAAEDWIDEQTGRPYLLDVVTAEDYYLSDFVSGPLLWLRRAPVASITSLNVRDSMSDTTDTLLVAGTDYEVRSLTTGELYVPNWASYYRLRVAYVPSESASPGRITLAATMLVSFWLQQVISTTPTSIQKMTMGDLSITYSEAPKRLGVPDEVMVLLGRKVLFV